MIARLLVALCAVSWLVMGGCARLVTIAPEDVPKYNSTTWSIKPRAAPTPASSGETAAVEETTMVAPSPTAPAAPVPFRSRPQIIEALRSPPDDLGIPAQLYAMDPLLTAHRKELESQASARRQVGTANIIIGVVCGAIGALGISYGVSHGKDPNEMTRTSANDALGYGAITAALSLGELVAGIVTVAGSRSDPTPLLNYYRETYAPGR